MPAVLSFLTAVRYCLVPAGSAFFGLGRLAAENLFVRKQLALFQERQVKPRRANNATRWLMAAMSRLFDWQTALVVVRPDTLIC